MPSWSCSSRCPTEPKSTRMAAWSSGRPATGAPARRCVVAKLPLATVLHDEALGQRPDLLESVIGAAGLAIEIARLRVEVRRQLAEVEESRERIVTAGYEERRRLERDLHDGAQQRLVSIGLALRHLQGQLPAEAEQAEILDSTVGEVARAIAELRELARGVRPAGLDDGLAAALQAARLALAAADQSRGDRGALRGALRDGGLFRRQRGAGERGQARRRVSGCGHGAAAQRRPRGLGCATTASAAPLPRRARVWRGSVIGSPRSAGSVTVASPAGEGTVVTVELPCG